jgi:hypothetical protein
LSFFKHLVTLLFEEIPMLRWTYSPAPKPGYYFIVGRQRVEAIILYLDKGEALEGGDLRSYSVIKIPRPPKKPKRDRA